MLLAAQLVELGEDGVDLRLRLADDALGLGFALAAGVLLGLFHLLAEGARLARVLLALLPETVGLALRALKPLALLLELRQHVLEADGLAVHLRAGGLDHVLIKTEAARDGEGVGLAGDTDEQAVRRAERLDIELAGRVLHARRASWRRS